MIKDSNYERVYSGSEISAKFVQNYLEDAGIKSVLRNDQESELRAGFGNANNQVLIFVEKENFLQANNLIKKAFKESEFSEKELEDQATASRLEAQKTVKSEGRPLIQKEEKPKRSALNIALNAGLLIYSLWRLYPLTQGESLPTFRIFLSGFIAAFCAFTLIRHFKK